MRIKNLLKKISIILSIMILPLNINVIAMDKNEYIPVAMSTDNNYTLPTIVSITSILQNSKSSTKYKFYILTPDDFLENNKNKILTLKENNNCEINFISMGTDYKNARTLYHLTTAAFYRLRLSSIISEDKCLYLDGDTIVLEDLSSLYNETNIDNYYVAGVKAPGLQRLGEKYAELLGIPDIKQYINTGVLVMNLKKIRNDNLEEKFEEFVKTKINANIGLVCHDQDVINGVCYNKILTLPFKYNMMTKYITNENDYDRKTMISTCFTRNEYEDGKNNPAIIHYCSRQKPWFNINMPLSLKWWYYASKTSFLEEIKDFYYEKKGKNYKTVNTLSQYLNKAMDLQKKDRLEIKKKWRYNKYKNLSPEKYPEELKAWYKGRMKKDLNLDNPKTFNEKIQWLKLYDTTPLKTKLSDKYLVRDFVKEKIGEKYLVPLLGVWDRFDDIDFDKLPDKFVLKTNHGTHTNIIVTDKSKFNKEEAKSKFDEWLNTNYAFHKGFELQYKDIKPKIIAEKYLENSDNDLYDYKIWCNNGEPEYIMFLSNRKKVLKMSFFDTKWNLMPFVYSHPRHDENIPKPDNLDKMLELSKKLSEGFSHVRIDFYVLNDGSIRFGEMTFTSGSGVVHWNPPEYDRIMGDKIILPSK